MVRVYPPCDKTIDKYEYFYLLNKPDSHHFVTKAMQNIHLRPIVLLLLLFVAISGFSQTRKSFFEPADTLDKKRFWIVVGTGTAVYTGFSIALYNTWYKDYPISNFHFFDDMGEWNDMDKMGHMFTAYVESNLSFQGALWTGMSRKSAMWTAAGVGTILQGTIEVMDGFSENWGFSPGDFAFNSLGVGLFLSQEMIWQEQRILMKVSSTRPNYNSTPILSYNSEAITTQDLRAMELFGSSLGERFLKDYNAQTIWLSANIHSFMDQKKWAKGFPKWLNVAVGYGVGNLYGGYFNSWVDSSGNGFRLDKTDYPRFRQYYLSLDVDLTKIPAKRAFFKSLLGVLNWIKIPAPSLEFRSTGQLRFLPFYW